MAYAAAGDLPAFDDNQHGSVGLLYPDDRLPLFAGPVEPLEFLDDLELNGLIDDISDTSSNPEMTRNLLCSPLADPDHIRYRQEIFADLTKPGLREEVGHVVALLAQLRRRLPSLLQVDDLRERQGWFLDAAAISCETVNRLADALTSGEVRSAGLTRLSETIDRYRHSGTFIELAVAVSAQQQALARVRYCIAIAGRRVEVSRYDDQPDCSHEIEDTFRRFQVDAPTDYRQTYRLSPALGRLGAQILALVADLFPDPFDSLRRFCDRHGEFAWDQITALEDELGFYLSYLDRIAPLVDAGLPFCYPAITDADGDEEATGTFDIALAAKLTAEHKSVVLNDFTLRTPRTDIRRHRPQPGRQNHLRPHLRTTPLPGQPRMPHPRPSGHHRLL